jgi:hypothetical protein
MKPRGPTGQGLPTPDPVKTGAAATGRLMLAKASGAFFCIHILNFRRWQLAFWAMLMETVYFESEYVTLYADPVRRMGRAVWNGFMSGEVFRSNVNTSLRLIEDKNPVIWLADNRKMKAIRQKDQEWFEKEVLPRLGASSLRKMATLISTDIFNQMAIENIFTRGDKLIRFDHQFFKDEQEALEWLGVSQTERGVKSR